MRHGGQLIERLFLVIEKSGDMKLEFGVVTIGMKRRVCEIKVMELSSLGN